MSDYDDELTRPLEGAAEASAAEGPTSPQVGRDEWVARHGERRTRRGGVLGTIEQRLAPSPMVGLARAVRRRHLRAARRLRERLRAPGRVRHRRLHAPRARAQHRRRLGRPARPRLRRVLRRGRVRVRAAELGPVRRPPADHRHDPARRGHRRDRRLARRTAVETSHGRLPRDRDAVLLPGLPHVHEQRRQHPRAQPHQRPERDPERRRVRVLRLETAPRDVGGALQREVPLRGARVLRRGLRRAPSPERLAYRPRVALAPRGPARGRGDGDARRPAQADGIRVRRRGRRSDGDVRDGAERECVPAELRVPAPDHRVHDGDPRGRGEPGGRRAGRGDRQRPARGAPGSRRLAWHVLRPDRPLARRRVPHLAEARGRRRRDGGLRDRRTARGGRDRRQLDRRAGGGDRDGSPTGRPSG